MALLGYHYLLGVAKLKNKIEEHSASVTVPIPEQDRATEDPMSTRHSIPDGADLATLSPKASAHTL